MNRIDCFIEALLKARDGNKDEAAMGLAKALGLSEPTEPIKQNVDALLLKGGLLRNTIVHMVANQKERR